MSFMLYPKCFLTTCCGFRREQASGMRINWLVWQIQFQWTFPPQILSRAHLLPKLLEADSSHNVTANTTGLHRKTQEIMHVVSDGLIKNASNMVKAAFWKDCVSACVYSVYMSFFFPNISYCRSLRALNWQIWEIQADKHHHRLPDMKSDMLNRFINLLECYE